MVHIHLYNIFYVSISVAALLLLINMGKGSCLACKCIHFNRDWKKEDKGLICVCGHKYGMHHGGTDSYPSDGGKKIIWHFKVVSHCCWKNS